MLLQNKTFLCAAILAAAAMSQAVPLLPGVVTPLPGISTIPGTVVQDVLAPFSFSAYGGTVSGQVQNRVTLKGDGTYLFEWRVFNDASSAGAIQSFRLGNFITSAYDGDWESAGLGDVNPTTGLLFAGGGGFVNFDWSQPTGGSSLAPGLTSFFFYLNTNATQYGKVALSDLTNVGQTEISGEYSTFAPVPEPASFAALGIGVVALARRRRK